MSWTPDQAAVISLRQRSDRRAAQGNVSGNLGFDAPYVWAVGADQVKPPERWTSSPASYANMLSHKMVLQQAKGSVVVLEDDALVGPDFQWRLQDFMDRIPAPWEAIMLGGEHRRTPSPIADGIVRCRYTMRTHGYLMLPSAVDVALSVMETATRHWDEALAEQLGSRMATFAPDPFVVTHTGFPGDIPDSDPLPNVPKGQV